MRYGLAPSGMGMSGDARTLAELASLAEEVGWDGFFLEDYVNAMTPANVRALKTFIEAQRVAPAPFDIVQGGWTPGDDSEQARAMVMPFAGAGATWWVEFISPEHGELDLMRTRIKQGPPRIEPETAIYSL